MDATALAAAGMHGQVKRLHPKNATGAQYPAPGPQTAPLGQPLVMAARRAGPFIARNAIASEVVKSEVAHLQIRHLGDAQARDGGERCSEQSMIPSDLRRAPS